MMKPIVPACFRGEGPSQDRISSSFLLLSGAGIGHRLEARYSRRSWGAVGVCTGPAWVSSLRSPAEIGQGREGSPACRQPAEELREKVPEPREEREKVRNGEPQLQPSPPAFLTSPAAASLPGHRSEPAPGEAAAPWQAVFFPGETALGCRSSQQIRGRKCLFNLASALPPRPGPVPGHGPGSGSAEPDDNVAVRRLKIRTRRNISISRLCPQNG